ncbi:hypothetical protein AB4144_10820 [Rhizobiaceae sp. 2RAB30]
MELLHFGPRLGAGQHVPVLLALPLLFQLEQLTVLDAPERVDFALPELIRRALHSDVDCKSVDPAGD